MYIPTVGDLITKVEISNGNISITFDNGASVQLKEKFYDSIIGIKPKDKNIHIIPPDKTIHNRFVTPRQRVTLQGGTGLFARFTERARKVMAMTNQEAQRFNHEYIGTEHMLLGLVKEGLVGGGGLGAKVLKSLNVDLRKIRLEVEKLVRSGPDMVTIGKLPQTPRCKKVIEYSIEEARDLNHNYIGTEHLLLGLVREQGGVAAQVLMNLGLKLKTIREEVIKLLGNPQPDGGNK